MKRTLEFLGICLLIAVLFGPAVVVGGLGGFALHSMGMPLWGAIPLGVLVAFVEYVIRCNTMNSASVIEDTIMNSVVVLVLGCILFPVFAQARQKAREATCRSHLKQLSLGLALYREDHDDKLPPTKNWQTVIAPYVKAPDIFACPASKHTYRYEQGRNGILLIDDAPAHSGRQMALRINGEVELLAAPTPAPKPRSPMRMATTSRRGGDSL